MKNDEVKIGARVRFHTGIVEKTGTVKKCIGAGEKLADAVFAIVSDNPSPSEKKRRFLIMKAWELDRL